MIAPDKPQVKLTEWYSTKQASEMLGLHRNTLRRYADSGVIRSCRLKPSGRRFFLGRDIIKFW